MCLQWINILLKDLSKIKEYKLLSKFSFVVTLVSHMIFFGICCFSAKNAALRRKSKDWLAWNQDNVSEWGHMSSHGLLFQWASTIKIQLSVLSSTKPNPQIHVRFLHHRHLYLRSMSFFSNSQVSIQFSNLCSFSNSQIGVQFSNLWLFLIFWNWYPLTYALTLTNKSAIDLRIWKGCWFEIMTSVDVDLQSGHRSEFIIHKIEYLLCVLQSLVSIAFVGFRENDKNGKW
jgi:hypothetical protein